MSVISPEEKRQPVTLRTTFWIPLPQRVRHTVLIMETANLQFSIHSPVKGATKTAALKALEEYVSIHAPVKGATYRTATKSMQTTTFQSTPP